MNWISDKWEQLNPNIQLQGSKWQHNELENIKKNLHPVSHSNTECPQNQSSRRLNKGKGLTTFTAAKRGGNRSCPEKSKWIPQGISADTKQYGTEPAISWF
jgi:hypothetical protein